MTSIAESVGELRRYIDELDLSGQDRLPAEPLLAEQLGVTRSRLRTILKRLEADGTIWRHVGKGTFIGPRTPAQGDQLSAVGAGDLFEARMLIEPLLAARAAVEANIAQVAEMQACVTAMRMSSSFHHWKRLDERLHRMIAEASHNALLLTVHDTLRAQARRTVETRVRHVYGEPAHPRETVHNEHAAIVEAIAAHDPERAAHEMHVHILSVRTSLFGDT